MWRVAWGEASVSVGGSTPPPFSPSPAASKEPAAIAAGLARGSVPRQKRGRTWPRLRRHRTVGRRMRAVLETAEHGSFLWHEAGKLCGYAFHGHVFYGFLVVQMRIYRRVALGENTTLRQKMMRLCIADL